MLHCNNAVRPHLVGTTTLRATESASMLPSPAPRPERAGPSPDRGRLALVLGGGNALGAYLAGAYERLRTADRMTFLEFAETGPGAALRPAQ